MDPDTRGQLPRASPRFPLRLKLGALTTALALIPLPVAGWLLLDRSERAVEHELRELQLAVADDVTASIGHELSSAVDGLDAIGRILTDPSIPEDASIALALRTLEAERSLDHASIYDRRGALVDTMRERNVRTETPATLSRELRGRAERGGFAQGEAISGEGAQRIPIVVPLRSADGETSGYVLSHVSLAGLQARVQEIAAHRFGTLEDSISVIDARGHVLAASEPDLSGTRRSRHPLYADVRGPTFDVAFAHQRLYDGGPGGKPALGTLVSAPSHRWAVIVQVPEDVAFAPIRQLRTIVLVTIAIVTIVALLAGLWLARSISAPVHALVGLARKLGRREFGESVEVRTNDELRLLGDTLSGASRELAESERKIREEHAIRGDLGRYLPAELVDRVVAREQDMSLGGVRRPITVLFADVVAFTPLVEQQEPETVVTILNELFTILTEIVFRHGGTVDKFIGDSVMALWGAPEPMGDHAARALRAAEDMMRFLETGNETWRQRFGITVRLAIGVHTGEAVVGNIGSRTRMTYTAIGDVVNVAARLEAMARPQQILVTQATRDAAGDAFETIDAGEHELAGRQGGVRLYEVRV